MPVSSADVVRSISQLIDSREKKELQKMNMFMSFQQMKTNQDVKVLSHQLVRSDS